MRIPQFLRRFLIGYLLLQTVMAGIFVLVLSGATRTQLIQESRNQMQALALVLRRHINELPDGIHDKSIPRQLALLGSDTNFRFTVIDSGGTVVADSEKGTQDIGPHGNRPEVLQAKANGSGFTQRYSSTLKMPMMYLAILENPRGTEPTADTGIIRVAVSADPINASIRSLQIYTWLFALVLIVVTGLVITVLSVRAMAPLKQFADAAGQIAVGKYDSVPAMLGRTDEWGSLADAFRHMQRELASRENSIAENSAKTEAVLSSMTEGVVAIDRQRSILLANRAACRMFELVNPDLVGRNLLEIVRAPELASAVEKTFREKISSKTEFQTTAKPRRIINASVAVLSAKKDGGNEAIGATVVFNDVTDLRQLETIRRDFVANVSHELKTPLASIKAYAETLRLGAIHDEQKNIAFVSQIESQAELLNRQIHDLLQLARVESGEQHWDIKAISINDLCVSSIEQFQSAADSRNIKISRALDPRRPMAVADAEGVRTILNNLISNAIHYTPGGGSVVVSTDINDSDVLIKVTDTGYGIDPEHQARIFERFYRVDKARSREMGGTGLGLSIVKHLVMAFEGSVKLESQLGKGSTFSIRLPAAT